MAEEARNKYQEWEQRRKEKLEEISGRIEEGMAKIMDITRSYWTKTKRQWQMAATIGISVSASFVRYFFV